MNAQQAVNLKSNAAVNTAGNHTTGGSPSFKDSVLVAAFQFPFECHLEDNVATIAQQYVRNVISCVKMIAVEVTQSGYSPNMGINLVPFPSETVALARRICQSYWQVESKLGLGGGNLLRFDCQTGNAMLKGLWQHQAAILCFLFKVRLYCSIIVIKSLFLILKKEVLKIDGYK